MNRPPYKGMNDPRQPLQRGPSHQLGFVRTLQGKLAALAREVEGLALRVGQRYGYGEGEPASFVGEKVYTPEDASFTLDLLLQGDNVANQQPVNYVVRDAMEHSVPIALDGPGVFLARYFKVTFYQRWWSPTYNHEIWYALATGRSFNNLATTNPLKLATVKWSIAHNAHFAALASERGLGDGQRGTIGINYFWNLVDLDSDRRLSDEMLSDQVLLNQSYQGQCDGDLMRFDVPWLFERAGVLDFKFQLINPILQLDPTATIFPFLTAGGADIDDRENGGSVRNQSVKVRAELHGTKYYNERDLVLREFS